jgi:hypothetical protein
MPLRTGLKKGWKLFSQLAVRNRVKELFVTVETTPRDEQG